MTPHDVLIVNPAGYRGTPRRGPYELEEFRAQCEANGLRTAFVDFQADVGAGRMPFPGGHIEAIGEVLGHNRARCILTTMRTTAGPWVLEMARLAKELDRGCKVAVYAPRIESRVRRIVERKDSVLDLLIPTGRERNVAAWIKELLKPPASDGIVGTPTAMVLEAAGTFELAQPWISPDRTIAAVQVGRGCPERCTFCAAHIGRGAVPAYAQTEAIVAAATEAFELLDARRRLFVMLETENLISAKNLVADICERRRTTGANFLWGAYGRIDDVDALVHAQLREGGCRFLFFGIESASPRLLKVLGKQFDVSMTVPRVKALFEDGIRTQCSFIFAIPSETRAEFLATAELMAQVAWAGSFVDWTPLRIEADSAMERIAQRVPHRILRESELFRDMSSAGVDARAFDPDAAYRAYGVEMADMDVDFACVVARRWRRLLTEAPLTMYILHKGLGLTVPEMAMRTDLVRGSDSSMWEEAEQEKEFIDDFFENEVRYNTMTDERQARPASFELIYVDLRKAPDLIPRVFSLHWWGRRQAQIQEAG